METTHPEQNGYVAWPAGPSGTCTTNEAESPNTGPGVNTTEGRKLNHHSTWPLPKHIARKLCYPPPNRNPQPQGSFCAAVSLLQKSVAGTANLEAAVQPLQSCNSVHGGLTLHLTRPRLPTFSLLLAGTGQWPVFSLLLASHTHQQTW